MKGRREIMDRIREDLQAWQGIRCGAPGCAELWTDPAHIEGSGMGGRYSTYSIENIVGLCRYHHDVFDGRELAGRQTLLRSLMAAYVRASRKSLEERRPSSADSISE